MFMLCWAAYAAAYLCRSNLSIALPRMISDLGWSRGAVGLVGSAFFWAYAVGQLINGSLGDRVDVRPFVLVGLCASAAANFLVAMSSSFAAVACLWAANGFCLSMLWGPMVRSLALWFPPERQPRLAMGLSTSMVAGYVLAWGGVGALLAHHSWRWAFAVPAGIMAAYAVVWALLMQSHPAGQGAVARTPRGAAAGASPDAVADATNEDTLPGPSLARLLTGSRLGFVVLACVAQGVVKDGIAMWTPTLLHDVVGIGQKQLALFSPAVPLTSLAGIAGAGWVLSLVRRSETKAAAVLLASAAAGCVALTTALRAGAGVAAVIALLACVSGLMYGANTLLLTLVPLKFARYQKVSGVAGFLDFCSYMGSAAAGVVAGTVAERYGWTFVVAGWVVLAWWAAARFWPRGSWASETRARRDTGPGQGAKPRQRAWPRHKGCLGRGLPSWHRGSEWR